MGEAPDTPPMLPSSYPDPEYCDMPLAYLNRLRNPFWSSPSVVPLLEPGADPGAESPAPFAPPLPPTTSVVSR